MNVFLSWSGARSKAVAVALKQWLPKCLQSVDPWMSDSDIDKGSTWLNEIRNALTDATGQGIFCVTPENRDSRWLNFEAGYIAAMGDDARVRTLLIDVQAGEVQPPLGLYQHTDFTRNQVLVLMRSLNKACARPIDDETLLHSFGSVWPSLAAAYEEALKLPHDEAPAKRGADDTLAEVLDVARRTERAIADQILQVRCVYQFHHSGDDRLSRRAESTKRASQTRPLKGGGAGRSRTDLHGFAIRCITALLPRRETVDVRSYEKGKPGLPLKSGAGDESRTRDLNLGKVALYQLSYSRGWVGTGHC
jgi:hypothetical protein